MFEIFYSESMLSSLFEGYNRGKAESRLTSWGSVKDMRIHGRGVSFLLMQERLLGKFENNVKPQKG